MAYPTLTAQDKTHLGARPDVILVAGDDYKNADGNALTWTFTGWPSLTSGTVVWLTRDVSDSTATAVSHSGTVVSSTSARVELTRTQTALFTKYGRNTYRYQLQVTLATSGNKVTLAEGFITVTERLST